MADEQETATPVWHKWIGQQVTGLGQSSGALYRGLLAVACKGTAFEGPMIRLSADGKERNLLVRPETIAPEAPPEPEHDFSIVRGRGEPALYFCSNCGTWRSRLSPGEACFKLPSEVRDRKIESTIGLITRNRDVMLHYECRSDAIEARYARRARAPHYSNISAALTIIGGWNRKEGVK